MLAAGTKVGAYEVVGSLGAGGMGEVYRARDAKLGRDVALKVLPEAFAADSERVARFDREARMLAALNHPHIAHVYGFEQAGSTSALVMELVDGDDLGRRLERGPRTATPAFGKPVRLLERAYVPGATVLGIPLRGYDVSSDGRRFLVIKDQPLPADRPVPQSSMTVVLDWFEELRARLSR